MAPGDTEQLALSIEIRKESGEQFPAIAVFFKRYEMIVVAADERDLLRVRTNVRGENVYLYRVELVPEDPRALLLHCVRPVASPCASMLRTVTRCSRRRSGWMSRA